jgi:ApeA N-terminal domain 1
MFTVKRYVKSGYVTTVSEDQKHEGLWWINEEYDKSVSGHLHVTPNGMWLALNGTLKTTEHLSHDPFSLISYDLIHGIQSNGYRFTLETCIESRKISPWESGYSIQKFSVDRVYSGIHVSSLDELKFSEYRVNYTYLSDWLRNVGLGSPEEVEGGFFIAYEPNKATTVSELKIELQENEAVIEIDSAPGWSHYNDFQDCKIEIQTIMTVFCKSPMSFSEVSSQVLDPIRDFINLATARPNSVTNLVAQVGDSQISIHSQSSYKGQLRSSLFNQSIVLFLAKDIAKNPDSYINKWFSIEQEMNDVCKLFFGVHYDQGAFPTNRLLNVVQALEAYSRVRYGEYKIPKEDHRNRSNRIVQSVLKEDRDWLRQALSYANNKSLKERLIELIDKARPLSDKLFPNPTEFAKWVVDTRNYLTHRDLEGKKRIAAGDKLDLMIHSLLWLLRILFLLEVGFNHEQCGDLLKNNREYDSLCNDPELDMPWKTNFQGDASKMEIPIPTNPSTAIAQPNQST